MQKITAESPESKSPDLAAENLAQLKALFPELVTESKDGVVVNVDVLKQLVGDKVITDSEEKYGLNWHRKRRARQIALMPSTGTLRPCRAESVDWGTTKNLMIEGDNLEVLKLLQKSYAGKVKLIYIDPPYNTGNDFVYPDNFQDNIKNYLELTGQTGEGGKKFSSNTEASGRFHTDWLNMMYPRLKLARNLLREDGVIFVSIDDVEISNLKKVCDEIFGEENAVGVFCRKTKSGGGSASDSCAVEHDYVVAYCKNSATCAALKTPFDDGYLSRYRESDEIGPYFWDTMERSSTATKPYLIKAPDGTMLKGKWFRSENTFLEDLKTGEVRFLKKENGWSVQFKQRLADGKKLRTILETSDLTDKRFRSLNEELEAIVGCDFGHPPKPVALMRQLIISCCADSDIVLDFFAGSCSTAHAILELNKESSGNLRFITVQIPEPCPSDSSAALAGYKTVSDIGKERIRRVGRAIKKELPLFAGDLGFRVFKLDSTNIREWDPKRDNLAASLEESVEHLKKDRSSDDILYELLLKLGLDLCVPIETKKIGKHEVHNIGAGSLLVCLSSSIPQAEVEPLALGIVGWHKELNPAGESTVVFKDSAFADDVAKTNLAAILQQHGIETVRSL